MQNPAAGLAAPPGLLTARPPAAAWGWQQPHGVPVLNFPGSPGFSPFAPPINIPGVTARASAVVQPQAFFPPPASWNPGPAWDGGWNGQGFAPNPFRP